MKLFKDFSFFSFIEHYCGSFLFNSKSNAKYFFHPLKHINFFKNNKYKIIRFLSYISPWLFFPYTLFTFVVWIIVFIITSLALITGFLCCILCEIFNDKLDKFKKFWNDL